MIINILKLKQRLFSICQTTCRCTRMPHIPRRTCKSYICPACIIMIVCIRLIFRVLPNRPMVGEQRRGTEGSRNDGNEGKRKDRRRGSSPQCQEGEAWHTEHSPFYMLSRFSSSHIPRKVLAPLLRFCDHSAAGSLYERGRPGRHHLNP